MVTHLPTIYNKDLVRDVDLNLCPLLFGQTEDNVSPYNPLWSGPNRRRWTPIPILYTLKPTKNDDLPPDPLRPETRNSRSLPTGPLRPGRSWGTFLHRLRTALVHPFRLSYWTEQRRSLSLHQSHRGIKFIKSKWREQIKRKQTYITDYPDRTFKEKRYIPQCIIQSTSLKGFKIRSLNILYLNNTRDLCNIFKLEHIV